MKEILYLILEGDPSFHTCLIISSLVQTDVNGIVRKHQYLIHDKRAKTVRYLKPKWSKLILVFSTKRLKTISFGGAHTCVTRVRDFIQCMSLNLPSSMSLSLDTRTSSTEGNLVYIQTILSGSARSSQYRVCG